MRYFIADCHFFHESLNIQMDRRGFASGEEMNEHMIARWNDRVRDRDEVVILGDLSVGDAEQTNLLLSRLKGKLCLVRGNHDPFGRKKGFLTSRFEWIRDYAEIRDDHRKLILCHYPIMFYNHQYKLKTQKTGGLDQLAAQQAPPEEDPQPAAPGCDDHGMSPERASHGGVCPAAPRSSASSADGSKEEGQGAGEGKILPRAGRPPKTWMLYGHVHDTTDEDLMQRFLWQTRRTTRKDNRSGEVYEIPCQMINCFCMFSDYVPLTIDEWIENDRLRREKWEREHAAELAILEEATRRLQP